MGNHGNRELPLLRRVVFFLVVGAVEGLETRLAASLRMVFFKFSMFLFFSYFRWEQESHNAFVSGENCSVSAY